MKTFTKFFTFLFAFILLSSLNVNAQHWTAPSGDPSAPLMEIYVYGAMLDATPIADGDQIAAFDGATLVGVLTVDISAPATTIDLTNWISNRLVVYSKDLSGNKLYEPGHPIVLKAWNGTEYFAYTWDPEPNGGVQIDFHDIWYAPTGDATGFVNQGPFFPAKGANSYCYVDLDFSSTAPTLLISNVVVTVYDAVGTPVEGAIVSSGGYSGTTAAVTGISTIPVFYNGDAIDYTFTVSKTGHDTEIFTVEVNGAGPFNVTINLDQYGNFDGTVYCYDLNTTSYDSLPHGAVVTTKIGDSIYSDWTDINGYFKVEDVPDGEWLFTVTYANYTTWDSLVTIANNTTTHAQGHVKLDLKRGTVKGEIFNAITLQKITTGVTVQPVGGTAATWSGGVYTSDEIAGTYDIQVSHASYETLTLEDFVYLPEITQTVNFNLVPDGYIGHFDTITGDPNNMWTIQIESAKFGSSSLLPYDELSIWDTVGVDKLVGALVFDRSAIWQNSGSNVMKAFAVLNNGTTGFVPGHTIEFRAYDVSQGAEAGVPVSWSFNQWMGTYHGNTFPNLTTYPNPVSYLNIYWDFPSGVLIGTVTQDALPNNPIEFVNVVVLDRFTNDTVGIDITDVNGQYNIPLDQGTFDVKFSVANYKTVTVSDVEIVLGENTTLNQALEDRPTATPVYSFTEQGFYFFGRCVGATSTDMLARIDAFTAPTAATFSTTHTSSWILNDGSVDVSVTADKLENIATFWEPLHTDGVGTYDWELLEGYQLYIQDIDYHFATPAPEYIVEPEDNPITFPTAGIYYIPYFPHNYGVPDDAITAFASIFDKLDWVMDSEGNRLHKNNGNWVDNIGVLSPEAGYKIKTTNLTALTFTYPAEATKSPRSNREMLNPVHFIYNEGNAADWTYTMYINTDEFSIGDEIAAYSNGIMVGSMVIDTEDAWENDLNTFYAAVEGGYETNTPIELMAWDASDGNEYTVGFEMVAINGNAYIGTMYPAGLDHFSYVNVYRGIVRVDENQIDNHVKVYPNPTNGTLNVESVSNINELRIYNVYGALVAVTNVNAKQQSMDVSNYTPGTYLVQLHTDTGVITKRVVVR